MKLLDIVNLFEHREQMIKTYVKTNIFDDEDVQIIDSITNGDPYTKLVSDVYYFMTNKYSKIAKPKKLNDMEFDFLTEFHNNLKEYNKNVFPLTDLYATTQYGHPLNSLNLLRLRKKIIGIMRTFPSEFLRNLKQDIRKERNEYEFNELFGDVRSIEKSLELVNRLSDDKKKRVFKKVFSSEFKTFKDIRNRFDAITIPYLNEDSTIEELIEKIENMEDEADIIYKNDNILAVGIKSFEAMSHIGCSSQWCFVTDESQWENYSPEGYCVIVFNLDEDPSENRRMVVVLSDGNVYDMYNNHMEDGEEYLSEIGVSDVVYRYDPNTNMALSEIYLSILNKNNL